MLPKRAQKDKFKPRHFKEGRILSQEPHLKLTLRAAHYGQALRTLGGLVLD